MHPDADSRASLLGIKTTQEWLEWLSYDSNETLERTVCVRVIYFRNIRNVSNTDPTARPL